MNKEHGQVTGIIWRGPDDLALYQRLKEYADKKGISVISIWRINTFIITEKWKAVHLKNWKTKKIMICILKIFPRPQRIYIDEHGDQI